MEDRIKLKNMIEKTNILGVVVLITISISSIVLLSLLTFFITGLKVWHVILILLFNFTIYFVYDYFYQKTNNLFFKIYPRLSKYLK